MNRPQLIVSDLDGTLMPHGGGGLSALTHEALAAAAEVGVPVIFATGRPLRWLDAIQGAATCLPWALLINGAVLYDLARTEVVWTEPIDPTAAVTFADAVRTLVPGVTFAIEYADHWGREPLFPAGHRHDAGGVIGPLHELVLRQDFMKMLVLQLDWAPDALESAVEHLAVDRLNVTFASRAGMLEVSSHGVSKGTSLARIAQTLEIDPLDVAAFGDMPNDLEMLHWAGRGYAMGNAHERVLAAGLPTIGHHHEDAVAKQILDLISLPPGSGWRPIRRDSLPTF